MADIAYLFFSLFFVVTNLVPTVTHVIKGNSGPAAFGAWVLVINLTNFANGVVWAADAKNRAPALCDISAKVAIMGPIGLLTANLCIIRFIAKIVGPMQTIEDRNDRRRRAFFDYGLSFGLPLAIAALSPIYQSARYGITRTIGCTTVVSLVWPTFVLYLVWPPILCGVACGYSVFVAYCIIQHRRNLRELIAKSNTPLSMSRFLRIGGLAATYFCISLPSTILGTIAAFKAFGPYYPFTRWNLIHGGVNGYDQVRLNPLYTRTTWSDWMAIAAGVTMFFFFSFARESLAIYLKAARVVRLDAVVPLLREKKQVADNSARGTMSGPRGRNLGATQISLKTSAWDASSQNSKVLAGVGDEGGSPFRQSRAQDSIGHDQLDVESPTPGDADLV